MNPVTMIGGEPSSTSTTTITIGGTSNTLVDLGKKLLEASKRGESQEIRALMSSGAPFTTDWLGTSPLHFAAMNGHLDTVTILLRAGISRDARTKVDRTPLHVSAQCGHFDIVQLLLKSNAVVDACDMLKMTPLHWAVENGHTNTVHLLLKYNADTTIIDKFDRSPMDIALTNMQMDIVQLLQGAPVPVRPDDNIVEETVSTDIVSTQLKDSDLPPTVIASEEIATEHEHQEDCTSTTVVENGNTSVLAALAALAEATSSASGSTEGTDTASWLSSRGVSVTANNSTATPFTLTEAGKLALTNFVSQQSANTQVGDIVTLVTEDGNQVLVVQEQNETADAEAVVENNTDSSSAENAIVGDDEPAAKVMKLSEQKVTT